MSDHLIWSDGADSIMLSPRYGGRIVSWIYAGTERVHPVVHYEGGLFRVLFAEEQYPGASSITPHQVLDWQADGSGFRAHLRHFWNTPNWFMRAADWPEKVNELHIDALRLDKVLTYVHAQRRLVCELTLTNISNETKYLTPWIHSSFAPWPRERWVTVGGERQEYSDTEIYWGAHRVPAQTTASIVLGDATNETFAVLGAPGDDLRGVCAMLPVSGEFSQAAGELRYDTIELMPGSRFRTSCYLALTGDWRQATLHPPLDLRSEIEAIPQHESPQHESPRLTELLSAWMLPAEQRSGCMIVSFLDKPPFYSAARFGAEHCFAGFHADAEKGSAHMMLYADRDLEARAELRAPNAAWRLRFGEQTAEELDIPLRAHDYLPLTLIGPADLKARDVGKRQYWSVPPFVEHRKGLFLLIVPELYRNILKYDPL